MSGDLPRRDLWLLPLIALVTVLGMFAGAEVASRLIWPKQLVNACRLPDSSLGVRYRPNCTTTMKTPEGPWYTASYNSCGYRSEAPCGALRAGDRRIAVLGTSISEGYLVEYANTIATRVGVELSRMCGARVEVQNLGSLGYFGDWLIPRMDEALRLRPDAVLFVMTPFDLEEARGGAQTGAPLDGGIQAHAGIQKWLFDELKESRVLGMAQSFLFRDPSIYVPLYLRYGDKADFMRPPFSARWRERLATFERLMGELTGRARRANVPFMLAFVPQEAQVALMAPGRAVPPGIVPTALQTELAAILAGQGASFVDTSEALRTRPAPERLYYQVDGHLSGDGQPVVAALIARRFTEQPGGPFADCSPPRSASLEARP